MARRTKEDAQKTRQALIESAILQFATRGVADTTLSDIAEAANLTRGAVYWHFTSKSELFNAIWEQQLPLCELIHDRLTLTKDEDPLLILRERFVTALQYISQDSRQRALFQILYHKCEFHQDMMSECEIRKRIGFNYENIRSMLERCVLKGLIAADVNIEMSLIIFHGFFSGIIKNWLMSGEDFNLYLHAPVLVDNILATLHITRVSPAPGRFYHHADKVHYQY